MATQTLPGTWTKRVPGSALLLFFLSLIVFTYLAVESWNRVQMELTALFTALASAAPLAIVYLFYVARPVWALQAPANEASVERAIVDAAGTKRIRTVNERKGVFRTCSAVLEVSEPPCTVGWLPTSIGPSASPVPLRSTVLVVPRSRDRKAVAAFRDAISGALLRAQAAA